MDITKFAEMIAPVSDRMIDASMKTKVMAWTEDTTALDVLHVLDMCVHGALCADIVIGAMDIVFQGRLAKEGKTREEVVALATWRNNPTPFGRDAPVLNLTDYDVDLLKGQVKS